MQTGLILLSWAMLVCCVSSQACDSGWFGTPNVCQYKCRCASGGCDSNGTCTSGGCQQGWFGPACQYVDLASSTQSAVTDGNDNSCLISSPPGSNVQVNLTRTTTFTWLRIRVRDSAFLHRLTLQFNDNPSLACLNPRNASVDDTTLDIHCDVGELVTSLTLGGEGVSYLCSVYVSGGRNVALRQPTRQVSTWAEPVPAGSENMKSFPSNQSVDGDTSGDFLGSNSCSCTQPNETVPNWNVSFPRPQRVQRFAIYGPSGAAASRMPGFTLQSFDPVGTMVFSYKDPHTLNQPQPVYPVPMPVSVTSSVSLVSVMADHWEKLLQLCEVEVFGDAVCDQGNYGRECEHNCSCDGGETCFVSTGGCPSGCTVGFYGESCTLPCRPGTYGLRCGSNCSQFCAKNEGDERSCDHVTGACLHGCESGYQGSTCTSQCSPGSFGAGCSSTCNKNCAQNVSAERSCDHVNGTCLHGCTSGYTDATCSSSCRPGTYGLRCGSNCSQFCAKNVGDERSCNHVTGACLRGCESGYQGSTCTSPCSPGTYGQDCKSNCSHLCVAANKTDETQCDHISGWCLLGCTGGYDSQFCNKEPDMAEGKTNGGSGGGGSGGGGSGGGGKVIIGAVVGSILGALVVTLVVFGAVVVARRCKNTRNLSNTDNSINGSNASLSGPVTNSMSVLFITRPTPAANAKYDQLLAANVKYDKLLAANAKYDKLLAANVKYDKLLAANVKYDKLLAANAKYDKLLAANVKYDKLLAANVKYDKLLAANAKYDKLLAANVKYDKLLAANVKYDKLLAANVKYDKLLAANVKYDQLLAANVKYDKLLAANVKYDKLLAANVKYDKLLAANVKYDKLLAANVKYDKLLAANVKYDKLLAANAKYDKLFAEHHAWDTANQRHNSQFQATGTKKKIVMDECLHFLVN